MRTNAQMLPVILRFRAQLSHSVETEGYHIDVIRSPGGGWGGPFLPEGLDDAHIAALRQMYRAYIERQLMASQQPVDERSIEALRVAGSQLFRALPETAQDRLHQAQSIARRNGKSVEIILAFEASARPLLSLPWELLHNPEGRYFYALRGGGITRQLWLPSAPGAVPASCPHALLGVWAEPQGMESLAVRENYRPSPEAQDEFVWISGKDTLGQLRQHLTEEPHDGLHIVAHGRSGENWSDFSLAFVAENGHVHWISPDQLAVCLSDYPQLRFVYLDVCASTVSGAKDDGDYLPGGLASALIGMGIPAVVAMQEQISQEVAGHFADTFYDELSRGMSLPQAMTSARRAARISLDDPIQWSIPALYMAQQPLDERDAGLRIVDEVLNRVERLFRPHHLLLLVTLLFAGYVSHIFTKTSLVEDFDWRIFGLPVVQSMLLPTLGAASMRAGQRKLGEDYGLDRSGWLGVLLSKYTRAAVWAWMWWCLVWLGWLILAWIGLLGNMGVIGRGFAWGVASLGLIAAGYTGARQSMRQSHLFLRVGRSAPTWKDWLLFLAMPVMPLALAWLVADSWAFLISPLGFLAVVAALALLGVVLARTNKH